MSVHTFGELVSTIDGVENFHLSKDTPFDIQSPEIREYIQALSAQAHDATTLGEFERKMVEEFGAGEILELNGFRLANCIAFRKFITRRNAEEIILPNGETPMLTETNLGDNIVDPLGWSSKSVAPSGGYGLLGKISKLRPSSQDYDEQLHRTILSLPVNLDPKGLAFEIGQDESVIMPTFSIQGEEVNQLIEPFSAQIRPGDISTAKHHGINS